MQLTNNRLAFLRDHIVAGRPILPGAAMLETAAAAGRTILQDGVSDAVSVAIIDAAIPAPVLLAATADVQLDCSLAMASGQLELQASTGAGISC